MTHSVGSLAMRSLGVPISALRCLTSTLRGMRHHVRTAYGDSDTFYSGSEEAPLQGGGQGNPAAEYQTEWQEYSLLDKPSQMIGLQYVLQI